MTEPCTNAFHVCLTRKHSSLKERRTWEGCWR